MGEVVGGWWWYGGGEGMELMDTRIRDVLRDLWAREGARG
jgi:hypothetical protein